MKKTIAFLAIILFVTAGCGRGKRSSTVIRSADNLITVDVTASYPEKELILQDFMDVEYIPLETNDDFLTQGVVLAVGKEIILVKNWINDGDIFIFDRKTGKGLRKINRKGQGGEEYLYITGVVLDENNNEIFVNSSSTKKILVYDLYGKFKRSYNHAKDTQYSDILFNYDTDHLICYDMSGYYKDGEDRGNQSYHAIISKQDGSITQEISIPFKKIKAPAVRTGDATAVTLAVLPIIPYRGNWILVETSCDTVYNYVPNDNTSHPFIVRTPSIHSMDPEIFLTLGTLTNRYYFIKTIKKIFDSATGREFPMSGLMYDKQENALFNFSVYNGDYTEKKGVDMTTRPLDHEIAAGHILEAYRLVDDYEKGLLKGRLKEIAAELDEESNPVIMLVKYKN